MKFQDWIRSHPVSVVAAKPSVGQVAKTLQFLTDHSDDMDLSGERMAIMQVMAWLNGQKFSSSEPDERS